MWKLQEVSSPEQPPVPFHPLLRLPQKQRDERGPPGSLSRSVGQRSAGRHVSITNSRSARPRRWVRKGPHLQPPGGRPSRGSYLTAWTAPRVLKRHKPTQQPQRPVSRRVRHGKVGTAPRAPVPLQRAPGTLSTPSLVLDTFPAPPECAQNSL